MTDIFYQCFLKHCSDLVLLETLKKNLKKVIWCNPPSHYITNMSKQALVKSTLKLMTKHFPNNSKCNNIFKLNILYLSYCCTTNFGNIFKQYNYSVLNKANGNNNHKCHCRLKLGCPLNCECFTQHMENKAVSAPCNSSFINFKTSVDLKQYSNHMKFFRNHSWINEIGT